MPDLTAIPGLPADAVEQLIACGVGSAEMLAALPPAEVHRVLELTAWQKGRLNRAPTLDMVHHWARLAREIAGSGMEDIPEAIAIPIPRTEAVSEGRAGGYLPRAQRARLQAAGPPVAAAPYTPLTAAEEATQPIPYAVTLPVRVPTSPVPLPEAQMVKPALDPAGFNSFEDYQAGKVKVTPLSRFSIDAPLEEREAMPVDRPPNTDDLPRTMRRGVVHPNPGLLIFGALISLIWRLAVIAALAAAPWLCFAVERPSDHKKEILLGIGGLFLLGMTQLIIMARARCRICTCHLFQSRNTVKNRKAHYLPGFGYTASLSLHLLLFQWFRCMYCGTAIKLWANKSESDNAN